MTFRFCCDKVFIAIYLSLNSINNVDLVMKNYGKILFLMSWFPFQTLFSGGDGTLVRTAQNNKGKHPMLKNSTKVFEDKELQLRLKGYADKEEVREKLKNNLARLRKNAYNEAENAQLSFIKEILSEEMTLENLKKLLKNESYNVQQVDEQNYNALHWAILVSREESFLVLLLKNKIKVDAETLKLAEQRKQIFADLSPEFMTRIKEEAERSVNS